MAKEYKVCELCFGDLSERSTVGICNKNPQCAQEFNRRYYNANKARHQALMKKWRNDPHNRARAKEKHRVWLQANAAARIAAGLEKEKSHERAGI